MKFSAACVTPPFCQIFQGTHVVSAPLTAAAHTGAPAGTPTTPPVEGLGTTLRASAICGVPRKFASWSSNWVMPT